MAPRAVLVGMPGSGKSTIGRRLARAMQLPLLDTDAKIVETTGRSIADLFAEGEPAFRRIEEQVVRAALAEHDGIVSLGGGAITSPGVREALAGHTVVFLEISTAEGVRRTTGGAAVRPLLAGDDPAGKYRELMSQRVPLFRRVATVRVNTNRRNPGAVVRHIVSRLENPQPPNPRRRRRPPWRRDPAAPAPDTNTTTSPPTPATLAARHREGTDE